MPSFSVAVGESNAPMLPVFATLALMFAIWISALLFFKTRNPRTPTSGQAPPAQTLRSVHNPAAARKHRGKQPRTRHEGELARARPAVPAIAHQQPVAHPGTTAYRIPITPHQIPAQRSGSSLPAADVQVSRHRDPDHR